MGKRNSLSKCQKAALLRMLDGEKLARDDGRWRLGDGGIRPATAAALLAAGFVRESPGGYLVTPAGAIAAGRITLDAAIRAVASDAPDEYARMYASEAMRAADEGGSRALEAQVRYIIANIQHWRGGRARAIRSAMRKWLAKR
jgi:hypothetical protein